MFKQTLKILFTVTAGLLCTACAGMWPKEPIEALPSPEGKPIVLLDEKSLPPIGTFEKIPLSKKITASGQWQATVRFTLADPSNKDAPIYLTVEAWGPLHPHEISYPSGRTMLYIDTKSLRGDFEHGAHAFELKSTDGVTTREKKIEQTGNFLTGVLPGRENATQEVAHFRYTINFDGKDAGYRGDGQLCFDIEASADGHVLVSPVRELTFWRIGNKILDIAPQVSWDTSIRMPQYAD